MSIRERCGAQAKTGRAVFSAQGSGAIDYDSKADSGATDEAHHGLERRAE